MTKSPLKLTVSKADAEKKIRTRIQKGQEIRDLPISSREELLTARAAEDKWSDYNRELLKRLFVNEDIIGEYNLGYGLVWGMTGIDGDKRTFREYMNDYVNRLESIFECLELIPEVAADAHLTQDHMLYTGKDVFIVHGHDEAARESVARFIEKLGLGAVILQEQPKGGRTIIEQLEEYSDVGFAIVLMTPDDIGVSVGETEEKLRARQNVIFEFGYFLGKLERSKVRILRKGNVEIPSDLQGVLYIPMDSAGAWRMALAKEIKNAGIEVDLNKL